MAQTLTVPWLAVPDVCNLPCAGPGCWMADWANCPWSQICGAHPEWIADRSILSRKARHLGGSNVGFIDGHAKWFSVGAIFAEAPRYACGCWGGGLVYGKLQGLPPQGPTSAAGTDGVAEGTCPPWDCVGVHCLY
jgi:prepilin-type processing-associated H-X9-DG protein